MFNRLFFWVEKYLFSPTPLQRLISYLLLPLTAIYCTITYLKRVTVKKREFGVPIISIGNLIVGGSGKTPITIALAKKYKNSAVVLRGYGRESQGLVVVSSSGKIICSVKESGDEAMELALSLPDSTIIVSEDRVIGIKRARELGAEVIFLDDAFSKHHIKKFDTLIEPKDSMPNRFCLPSGPYRERKSLYSSADLVLKEGRDFKRVFKFDMIDLKNSILITAISKPYRLEEFLPKGLKRIYLPDHHQFRKDEIDLILKEHNVDTILTTMKDYVKIKDFGFSTKVISLEIELLNDKTKAVEKYIELFGNKEHI